jgi:alpha/beta superfamily hydrolase
VNRAPQTDKLFLQGPVGRLEALLDLPGAGDVDGAAIVCHPHPQHGGTMHNKVAHTLARAFVRSGFATLRFNFRGTEGSEGEYDDGRGELDDALAAVVWLRERYADRPLWLAGFSFGAAIAVRTAVLTEVDGLVVVAPAIYRFAKRLDRQPDCPWLVIQGDEDELVDVDETLEWINSLEPGPELLVVPGAEHFFHGRLIELRNAVFEFVANAK